MNIPKQFTKALKILAAAPLLAGSMAANAALIEVSYEGSVSNTSGDGAGYSVGDFLSGTLVIDTDLLPVDRNSSARIADYFQTNSGDGEFVSGGINNDDGLYDRVYINDSAYGYDQFYLMDRDYEYTYINSSTRSISDRFLNLNAYGYGANFLNGVTAEQVFDLAAGDVSYMGGRIYDYEYVRVNGFTTSYNYGVANFNLTRLTVGPAAVPAPTSLALLGLGLLGLGAARRRKARVSR